MIHVSGSYITAAETPPLWINVPAMQRELVGRAEVEQRIVDRLLAGGSPAIATDGQGGVGKTALAVAVAHRRDVLQHFSDGVLWAGLGVQPDAMTALAEWGRSLGVDVSGFPTPEDRRREVRNAIGHRPILLVIDDAWDADTAELLRCGGPRCRHLLTTRDMGVARHFALAGGTEKIESLEEEDAFELLRQLAPEACASDPDAARDLADAVGGLPLALELVGGYLAEPERNLFPELTDKAFTDLADPAQRLSLARQRLGARTDTHVPFGDVIALSLHDLPDATTSAFYSLGAFPPKPETFDREAARTVTETDDTTLARLIARNLLELASMDGQRFTIHQTIADYARNQMEGNAHVRHALHYAQRLAAAGENWRAVDKIYGHLKWDLEVLAHAPASVFWRLANHQRIRGLRRDAIALLSRRLEIERESGTPENTTILLNNLGYLLSSMGAGNNALDYLERALTITQEAEDRRNEVAILINIGSAYKIQDNPKMALEYFRRALPISQEVGDRSQEAATLHSIGSVYNRLGQRKKALRYYKRALAISQEIGEGQGEAITLNSIGSALDTLGRRKKALQYFERALPIALELGDRSIEAATLMSIARTHASLGQLEQAIHYFERALTIQHQIGDHSLEVYILSSIASAHINLGQWEQALHFFDQAVHIRQAIGDRSGEASTRLNVALILRRQGNLEKAVTELRRVVELDEMVQHPGLERDRAILTEVEKEWKQHQEQKSRP